MRDPESWQVSVDSVLMRLALRSGLVEPGDLEPVRVATREAFAQVATASRIPPPVLDDMLWDSGATTPTCSATRPATCTSRRATRLDLVLGT